MSIKLLTIFLSDLIYILFGQAIFNLIYFYKQGAQDFQHTVVPLFPHKYE